MNRNDKLQQLANSINAANELHNIYNSRMQRSEDPAVNNSMVQFVSEALEIIANHSPEQQKKVITDTLSRCNTYYETYRNLKQHVSTAKTRSASHESFLETLRLLKPALGNREQVAIDKLFNILDILRS